MKLILLINASLAASLLSLYWAVRFCNDFGLSPWLAAIAPLALYAAFVWREVRACE